LVFKVIEPFPVATGGGSRLLVAIIIAGNCIIIIVGTVIHVTAPLGPFLFLAVQRWQYMPLKGGTLQHTTLTV
jgi:hypothetical protein